MSELHYELTPWNVRSVRVNLFGFLSQEFRAPRTWAEDIRAGRPMFAPPGSEKVPHDELGAWLAAEQAARVAQARLFWLDPSVGDLAIQVGGDMSVPGGIAPVRPPRPYGLMLCPNGLGYSADGMVVIAAAWGPIHEGYWVTWWADAREYIQWSGDTGADAERLLRYMGMLHYITGGYMTIMYADTMPPDHAPIEVTVDPHPTVTFGAGTLQGCFNATAGAWWLLDQQSVDVEMISPTAAQAEEERRYGVLPSKVTRAYLAATSDPARLWDYDTGPVE